MFRHYDRDGVASNKTFALRFGTKTNVTFHLKSVKIIKSLLLGFQLSGNEQACLNVTVTTRLEASQEKGYGAKEKINFLHENAPAHIDV